MLLNDPVHQDPQAQDQERVPTVGGEYPPASGDRFRSAPLSRAAMASLQRSLVRQQRRRLVYRARQLRVYLDGVEHWQVDPRNNVCEPFRVPLSASYLEIFGDDAEGTLLLAVCPLPTPEEVEDDGVQHVSVTLEGGQTLALTTALGEGTNGEARAYVLQLAYTESAAVDTQVAEPSTVAGLPAGSGHESSALGHPRLSTPQEPHDHGDERQIARMQLFGKTRRIQAKAKELRAMGRHQLQCLQQLHREMKRVLRRLRALDRQPHETHPRDAP
jgi:hypothetical protein